MSTVLTATLALVLGGGGMPPQAAAPAPALSAPAQPVTATVRPTVPVTLHYQSGCTVEQGLEPGCGSGEAALSAEQVGTLARLFDLKAEFRPVQEGEVGPYLDLSVTQSRLGLNGIGGQPSYVEGEAAYYSAAQVISFIAQVTDGAYLTATPRLTLHTERTALDMGPVSPQRLREFFSADLPMAVATALLPHILDKPLSCKEENVCNYPGVSTIVWGEQPQRIQTGLAAGEVAVILTAGPRLEPSGDPGVITSVGIVEPGGWATFYLPSAPARLVADPAQITLRPEDAGNALLVRLTNTPLNNLKAGIVQPK
ncbi:hypothetical protein ACFP81_03490 [Deinococcus lacus]|uniref:Uncharacterized protein n=1 Tax=Deinococcus lacus TaxID=392561 RepID=A0ABW1YE60_9DEIO